MTGTARPSSNQSGYPNVPTVALQGPATAAVVARVCAFGTRGTAAWREFEIERTALDEVPEPPRGLGPELAVGLARNSTGLGRIEAY